MNNSKPSSESFSQKLSILLIRAYQRARPAFDQVVLSVFGVVSECKHKPTCSEYAIGSIRRHGTIAGVVKGLQRILACR